MEHGWVHLKDLNSLYYPPIRLCLQANKTNTLIHKNCGQLLDQDETLNQAQQSDQPKTPHTRFSLQTAPTS